MKETKEPIKVNVSTFLLIIAMIVIGVMAYFMYSQKMQSDKDIVNLQDEAKKSQATINELQSKLDNVANIASSDKNTSNTETKSESKEFSDTEIRNAIQKYLDLKGLFYGDSESLIGEEGLGFKQSDYANGTKAKTDGYTKTSIKYTDFKQKIYKYMTEKCFKNEYGNYYIEEDGMLCYKKRGASGALYTLKSYTSNSGKYITKVDFSQAEEDHSEIEFEFELVDNSTNVVVDYCKQIQ